MGIDQIGTGRVVGLTAVLAFTLAMAACGGNNRNLSQDLNTEENEAPPAAPFSINVQNQNSDNNYGKYKQYRNSGDEGKRAETPRPAISQNMADSLAAMEGIQTAHVLVSGEQAFVAVTLGGRNQPSAAALPESMRSSITERIRSMDSSVHRVYVTDQMEFVRRFETIHSDQQNGRQVDGLLRELSESAGRIIPDWAIGNLTPHAVHR